MANIRKPKLDDNFRHHTSIGDNGQLLFDAPIEIKNQQDLNNYGITWDDCRTLNFHGSERVTVYFLKVESRELAEYQWAYLDTQHSRGYASTRCMIPGKRKAFIKCPDTNRCSTCKFKDVRRAPVVSWDGLLEAGYDPGSVAPYDEQISDKLEYLKIRALMDAEDTRIAVAFELKELYGLKVEEIAQILEISIPRVYQLISLGKKIVKQSREN